MATSESTLFDEYGYETLPDGTYAITRPKDRNQTKHIIPEGVSIIKSEAFSCYSAIEEVVLPSSLRVIEEKAFWLLKNLKKINFPSGLEVIGAKAFTNNGISTAILPEGLKKLGSDAFEGCKLKKVVIPSTLKEIDNSAFYKAHIDSIVIPSTIKKIGNYAFLDAHIDNIKFNEGLEYIGDSAFKSATLPKTIYLPNTLKEMFVRDDFYNGREGPFKDAKNLQQVVYDGPLDLKKISDFRKVDVISTKEFERAARAEAQKAEAEAQKAEAARKLREEKGIVSYGDTSEKNSSVVVNDVKFFYDQFSYNYWIKGMEIKKGTKHIELPKSSRLFWIRFSQPIYKAFEELGIESITLPRSNSLVGMDLEANIKRIIIPSELGCICKDVKFFYGDNTDRELYFDNTYGWSINKRKIDDPKKAFEFAKHRLVDKKTNLSRWGALALINKIVEKLKIF